MWLSLAHLVLETWSATQACALTGNQTSGTLVCRPTLNSLRYISQGSEFLFFKKDFIYVFLERGERGKREEEKHQCMRETSIGCLLNASQPETRLTTQSCALTGNQTSDPSLCGVMPKHLSYTG